MAQHFLFVWKLTSKDKSCRPFFSSVLFDPSHNFCIWECVTCRHRRIISVSLVSTEWVVLSISRSLPAGERILKFALCIGIAYSQVSFKKPESEFMSTVILLQTPLWSLKDLLPSVQISCKVHIVASPWSRHGFHCGRLPPSLIFVFCFVLLLCSSPHLIHRWL